MSNLRNSYEQKIRNNLKTKLNYKNIMQVPRLKKVVINMGVGEAVKDSKKIQAALQDMMLISGQKALQTTAKKSEAGFKIREGMPVGVKVTLRKTRMYEFLDRLINIALPRVRDFRGLSEKSFDGRGNYSLGIKEQLVFPEIDYDKIDTVRGMDITIETSATTNSEALELLREFNMPFTKLRG